jgi:hypothetical protein
VVFPCASARDIMIGARSAAARKRASLSSRARSARSASVTSSETQRRRRPPAVDVALGAPLAAGGAGVLASVEK